jgi:hypothetical protein
VAFDRLEPVLPIPAPTHVEPHVPRVTLNPRIVAGGADGRRRPSTAPRRPRSSARAGGEVDERRWPAQLARREGATWIVDEAAASAIRR